MHSLAGIFVDAQAALDRVRLHTCTLAMTFLVTLTPNTFIICLVVVLLKPVEDFWDTYAALLSHGILGLLGLNSTFGIRWFIFHSLCIISLQYSWML